MGHIVIGERASVRKNFGQFNAFIENAGSPREPCVIFTPANRSGKAFGIALSMLHEYFDDNALPTGYCLRQMEKAARMLGFEDRGSVHKLMDALYSMVTELVKAMPAELEEQDKVLLGEAELRVDGQVIGGTELYQ